MKMSLKLKRKLLIVVVAVLGLIGLAVVFAFTLFALKSVSVNFIGQTTVYEIEENRAELIDSSQLKLGTSLFLIDKNYHISVLEKDNPYVKVLGIEFKFPNNIIIHCIEREEIYAYVLGDLTYIFDSELKVLRIEQTNHINLEDYIITEENLDIENDLTVGSYLHYENNLFMDFYNANFSCGETTNFLKNKFNKINFISKTDPVSASNFINIVLEEETGYYCEIYLAQLRLNEKLQKLYAAFLEIESLENVSPVTHKIIVYSNIDGEILAYIVQL